MNKPFFAWRGPVGALFAALIFGAAGVVHASPLDVRAGTALVMDSETGRVLFAKNEQAVLPIASLTKIMTALIVLDAGLDPDERITITDEDQSRVKYSRSRLAVGTVVTRADLLRLALMASENRAASALARTYPGGTAAGIAAMNAKAALLGLENTRFEEPTGLSSNNVSSATDLAKLTRVAHDYPLIREYSTLPEWDIPTANGRTIRFGNTNGLVRKDSWDIDLQKTGFISEAGRCLVLSVKMAARPLTIVLLDAAGRYTHFADAQRIRQWMDPAYEVPVDRPTRVVRAANTRVATAQKPAAKPVRAAATRPAPARVIAPRASTPVQAVVHKRPAQKTR